MYLGWEMIRWVLSDAAGSVAVMHRNGKERSDNAVQYLNGRLKNIMERLAVTEEE